MKTNIMINIDGNVVKNKETKDILKIINNYRRKNIIGYKIGEEYVCTGINTEKRRREIKRFRDLFSPFEKNIIYSLKTI